MAPNARSRGRTGTSTDRRAWLIGALGGAALALTGGAGQAEAATPINNCGTVIGQSGAYFLARDLSCPGTGITITADDVRLDLNGRTLAGTEDSGYGIYAQGAPDHFGTPVPGTPDSRTLTGLSVTGPGTVSGFVIGLYLDEAPGARVARVAATGNKSEGVRITDSPGVKVVGVTATGNGTDGIDIHDSPGARATGNTATRNAVNGIYVLASEDSEVAGNRAADNGTGGIVTGEAPRSRIADNTATRNGRAGIDVFDCPRCVIADNQVAESGEQGLLLEGATTGARIAGNTATGNVGAGIRVDEGATGNTLERNRARGNDPVDLADENVAAGDRPACANRWWRNAFRTDSEGDGPGAGCIR